jgi:hypothetical protein
MKISGSRAPAPGGCDEDGDGAVGELAVVVDDEGARAPARRKARSWSAAAMLLFQQCREGFTQPIQLLQPGHLLGPEQVLIGLQGQGIQLF